MYKMKNEVTFIYYVKLSIKHVHSPFYPHPSPPTIKMIDLSKPFTLITKNTAVQVRYLWPGLTFYTLEFSQNMSPTSFNSIQILFFKKKGHKEHLINRTEAEEEKEKIIVKFNSKQSCEYLSKGSVLFKISENTLMLWKRSSYLKAFCLVIIKKKNNTEWKQLWEETLLWGNISCGVHGGGVVRFLHEYVRGLPVIELMIQVLQHVMLSFCFSHSFAHSPANVSQ